MSRTLMARIGYLLAKGAFDLLREKMDPGKVNGGVFLGLNGIVIKSHGGADVKVLRRRRCRLRHGPQRSEGQNRTRSQTFSHAPLGTCCYSVGDTSSS
jgi:fatty acid/phospholipid biosynthesis enzyme